MCFWQGMSYYSLKHTTETQYALIVNSQSVLNLSVLEDKGTMFPQNVGTDGASYPKRMESSATWYYQYGQDRNTSKLSHSNLFHHFPLGSSPPSSAVVKSLCCYISTPPCLCVQEELYLCLAIRWEPNSTVSTVTRLWAGLSRVWILAGASDFLFSKMSRPAFRAHPAPYSISTWSSLSRGKVAGAWSWPLTSLTCKG